MIKVVRTDSSNKDFINLVKLLDAKLKERDGELHSFYNQYNKIEMIKYAVVAYKDETPIGCGAIKEYDDDSVEVKRMYLLPNERGSGTAAVILTELEKWAKELSKLKCVLETGKGQPEAIKFYLKSGYNKIKNYGQYAEIENSVCFEKYL